MISKKAAQQSAKSVTAINKESQGFTDEERAALKERAKELKAERIVEPLEKKPWELRQFTVEDIDGNRFYFHCD